MYYFRQSTTTQSRGYPGIFFNADLQSATNQLATCAPPRPHVQPVGKKRTGTLSITGAFDALEYIGWSVFSAAGTAGSKVQFASLQSLQFVGTDIFGSYAQEHFKGVVAFPAGPFPFYSVPCGTKLSYPDGIVLLAPGNTRLSVELYESGDTAAWGSVTCIPEYEFYQYEGDVTLRGPCYACLATF